MKYAYYVRANNGQFYALVKSSQAKHGFFLCDGDRTYDGGFGANVLTWERVKSAEVPRGFKDKFWTLAELKAEIES